MSRLNISFNVSLLIGQDKAPEMGFESNVSCFIGFWFEQDMPLAMGFNLMFYDVILNVSLLISKNMTPGMNLTSNI